MSLKEYFFGTETARYIRYNRAFGRSPQSDSKTDGYVGLELCLSKWIPNIITAGSLIAAAVSRDPNFLWGAAASEAFRNFYSVNTLRIHRDFYLEQRSREVFGETNKEEL